MYDHAIMLILLFGFIFIYIILHEIHTELRAIYRVLRDKNDV